MAAAESTSIATIAARASLEAGGSVPAAGIEDFLGTSLSAVRRGRRLSAAGRARCQSAGTAAARAGTEMSAVVDAYLSATRLAWSSLPELAAPDGDTPTRSVQQLIVDGERLLRAADDALAAVAQGHAAARRQLLREEASTRREFVDDLLSGGGDVAGLVARSEHFGIRVTAPHLVAVADARARTGDAGTVVGWAEQLLRARLPGRDVLVATKDGRLVLVVSTAEPGVVSAADRDSFTGLAAAAAQTIAADDEGWRLAVGYSHLGPTGISTSYREALDTLELANRIDHPARAVHAEDVAVYRVVMRDTAAITDLVSTVFDPLRSARGGEQLFATLVAFFAAGAVATETARVLHLSVRAVTYRLDRVRSVIGLDPADPADWLILQVALAGARLLGWPTPRA